MAVGRIEPQDLEVCRVRVDRAVGPDREGRERDESHRGSPILGQRRARIRKRDQRVVRRAIGERRIDDASVHRHKAGLLNSEGSRPQRGARIEALSRREIVGRDEMLQAAGRVDHLPAIDAVAGDRELAAARRRALPRRLPLRVTGRVIDAKNRGEVANDQVALGSERRSLHGREIDQIVRVPGLRTVHDLERVEKFLVRVAGAGRVNVAVADRHRVAPPGVRKIDGELHAPELAAGLQVLRDDPGRVDDVGEVDAARSHDGSADDGLKAEGGDFGTLIPEDGRRRGTVLAR